MDFEEQNSIEDSDRTNVHLRVSILTTTLTGLLMLTLSIIWVCNFASWSHDNVNGNIHIILMVAFFIFFHGLVNLIHRIFPDAPTLKVKFIHFFMHLVVILGVVMGLFFAVKHHEAKGDYDHFYSFHSWIGLLAIILYFGQFLVFLVKFGIFLLPFVPMGIRKLILPANESLGPVIFVLSVVAALTGVMMKATSIWRNDVQKYGASHMTINFTGVSILLFSVAVIHALRIKR